MFYLKVTHLLILLFVCSFPAWSARELVDDFNGVTIDFSKWSNFDPALSAGEFVARIDTAANNLVLREASDGSRYQRTRIKVLNTTLTALQATIAVTAVNDGGSEAAASVEGQYYNAVSAVPSDSTGDVFATVHIGDRGNGLEAWWEIIQSTHPDFATWNVITTDTLILAGILNLDTPYITKIEYDGNRSFTFTVAGMSSGPVSGPVRMGPPDFPSQRLSTSTNCCGIDPSIQATFDDVVLDNGLVIFDDFSTGPHIDSSKWETYLGSRVITAGKLLLDVADEDVLQDGGASSWLYLKERNPNYVEARISVSNTSLLEANLAGRARLSGYFYNERRDGGLLALPYDESDGDVWGRVDILLFNGVLSADAYLESELTGYATDQQLLFKSFTKPIAFDTEYLVSIQRDGNRIIFRLDDEKIVHNITTPAYPPSSAFAGDGYRLFSSRIHGTPTSSAAGASGIFAIYLDDVYVGTAEDTVDSNGGSGGGGCFIATAAYGSYLDPHVRTLRSFRDQYLLTNSPGEWVVGFYYRHSPPIADYIREREMLRAAVRSVLAVVVYSIEYPLVALLVLLLLPLAVVRWRKRRNIRNL